MDGRYLYRRYCFIVGEATCDTRISSYDGWFDVCNRNGEPMLYFGELAGDGDYDDEPFTIHWPDGSTDVITVKNKAYLSSANRKFKLNGKVVAKDTGSPIISIVK